MAVQSEKKPDKQVLAFPDSLRSKIDKGFPHVQFTMARKGAPDFKSIHLFMPQGVASADGASYGSTNLGLAGAAKAASGSDEITGSDVIGQVTKAAKGLGGITGASGQIAELESGVIVNPYTTMTFDGTVLRSFAFAFKLVPESAAESVTARDIENIFRKYLYPKDLGAGSLEYPPTWKVKFMNGESVNKYMPRIIDTYLINMTATYNSTGNSFHKNSDGAAPVEIDVALTFQEVRAITRDDLYPDNGLMYISDSDSKDSSATSPSAGG